MTIKLPDSRPLGPEDIRALVAAYKQVLVALRLKDHDDPMTKLVAKKVFQISQMGVRESSALFNLALEQLEAKTG